jgi:hypothetical protein
MSAEARLPIREEVSRFFPCGVAYDHDIADRFIKWLDKCGYEIVPIEHTPLVPETSETDSHRMESDSAPLITRY